MTAAETRQASPPPRRAAGTPLRRTVLAWALALVIPMFGIAGFTVATDPSGYFRLNSFGSYGGDELFIKSSLMRYRPHEALLLGDSRAAFSDPRGAGTLQFFNAASGGASIADTFALLRRADLQSLRLVVLMVPVGDILGICRGESRLDDPMAAVRRGATVDALAEAVRHLRRRLRGDLPDHRFDGTRYPDGRILTPVAWDGSRAPRYRERVAAYRDAEPLDRILAEERPCTETLYAMRDYVEGYDAEFLLVLAPLNRDLLQASGTDEAAVRRVIAERLLSELPFAVDFTASRFSDSAHFPPSDSTHFRPEVGGAVLAAAIERFCRDPGRCVW